MTLMKAAVATAINEYSIQNVILDEPKAGEIKIQVKACGVCHSDMGVINGTIPQPLPQLLGHEGAGIVVAVGDGVTKFEVGDHVITTLAPACGKCKQCLNGRRIYCEVGLYNRTAMQLDGTTRVRLEDGTELSTTRSLGMLAEYAVVSEMAAVKIPKDSDFRLVCLIGCGVITGAGAVINTAKVTPGETVAVIGCGGIGLSAIQGARIAGARKIIGVDIADSKLEMAKKMGATHIVNGLNTDSVPKVLDISDGGVDYVFETAGNKKLVEDAVHMTRMGGEAILIGFSGLDKTIDGIASDHLILQGKSIKGCKYGDANAEVDFPMLIEHCKNGCLDLESMVSQTYSLDELPKAYEDMEESKNARGVIMF